MCGEPQSSAVCPRTLDLTFYHMVVVYRHSCSVIQQSICKLWAISSRISNSGLHRQENRHEGDHLPKVTDAVEAKGRPPACCQAAGKAFAKSRLKQICTPNQPAASYAVQSAEAFFSSVLLFKSAYVSVETVLAKTAGMLTALKHGGHLWQAGPERVGTGGGMEKRMLQCSMIAPLGQTGTCRIHDHTCIRSQKHV